MGKLTSKGWFIALAVHLVVDVALVGFLTWDLGFNDGKVTNSAITKAQDKLTELRGTEDKFNTAGELVNDLIKGDVADPLEKLATLTGVENKDTNTGKGSPTITVDENEYFATWKLTKEEREALKLEEFSVSRVSDGDTVRGTFDDDKTKTSQSIRIAGIDTPESTSITKPNVWQLAWGKRAGLAAKKYLFDKEYVSNVYVVRTSETSHGRVVGSMFYSLKSDIKTIKDIYSYGTTIVGLGLAIPGRLKSQNEFDLGLDGVHTVETKYETQLKESFATAFENGLGFFSNESGVGGGEDTGADAESYETSGTAKTWDDITDGDAEFLDFRLPDLDADDDTSKEQWSILINQYVYPKITWWESAKRTTKYCTLDTLADEVCTIFGLAGS